MEGIKNDIYVLSKQASYAVDVKPLLDKVDELESKAAQLDSPHIQELIECDRIERKLIHSGHLISVKLNATLGIGYSVIVGSYANGTHEEVSKSKLEALRKAEVWLDGRCAE